MDNDELNSELSKHKVKFMSDEETMCYLIKVNENVENDGKD